MQKAFVDLHRRLSHLTSFASGLILVAGEGEGHQQAFVGEFLASQGDELNLAYIKANTGKEAASYRQTLVNQLIGNISLDPRRPLSQTLDKLLDSDPQPMLICISAADALPDELLRELWQLVQKMHEQPMCVILFGSLPWVERITPLLPGPARPIQVNYNFTEQDAQSGTELERMIAQKRQAFNARLAARQEQVEQKDVPKRSSIMLRLLIVFVFLGSFGGVLGWFYKAELDVFWAKDAQSQIDVPASVPVEAAKVEPEAVPPSIELPEPQAQQMVPPPAEQHSESPVQVSLELSQANADSTDELVADWQSQAEKIQPPALEQQPREPEPETNLETVASVASEITTDSLPEAPQVPALSETSLWNEAEVLALPPTAFVLQLSAASDPSLLQRFIQTNQMEGLTWRYETRRYGGPWHVVLSNQSFESLEQARIYIHSLPVAVQSENPFAKTVRQVHNEIDLLKAQ